jgi:hypothetical protein
MDEKVHQEDRMAAKSPLLKFNANSIAAYSRYIGGTMSTNGLSMPLGPVCHVVTELPSHFDI